MTERAARINSGRVGRKPDLFLYLGYALLRRWFSPITPEISKKCLTMGDISVIIIGYDIKAVSICSAMLRFKLMKQ